MGSICSGSCCLWLNGQKKEESLRWTPLSAFFSKRIETTPEPGLSRDRFLSSALNYILVLMRYGMALVDALGGLPEQTGKWAVIYSPSGKWYRRPATIFQRSTAHSGEPFSYKNRRLTFLDNNSSFFKKQSCTRGRIYGKLPEIH